MKTVIATLNAKYIHASLALRYLKAYCQQDFELEMMEFTIRDTPINIVTDIINANPTVVGFSCYIWNIEETIILIDMLKKINPQLKIILGGPEVSYDVAYWMERLQGVDFIVVGEGEETLHHLLSEIEGEHKYDLVFGIAYRKGEEVVINPPNPRLDLNDIPSPYIGFDDIEELRNRVVYYETSRGCPFSCSFCLSSIEVGVRYFDIERAKKELKYLIDNGVKLIKFVDRTFNIRRDYAMEIFDFLIKNHGGAVFQFEITADIMRPEVLDYLAEHAPPGIFRFEIGVQSTNDATNILVERRQNFDKLSHTVMTIKNAENIDQHLDLIAGLPEEDYDSFRKTFNDVFAMRPEELQLGFLKMLRGTGMRINADKYGYKWMEHAPYEILGNDVLPFSDIVKIKRVEDVLEKYWNAHRLDRTVEFLVSTQFETPFDFFQQFGDYWELNGWQRIGHQLEDLFTRLYQFLEHIEIKDLPIAKGIMQLDYFLTQRNKPRRTWWTFEMEKSEQQRLMRLAANEPNLLGPKFTSYNMDERELHKRAVVELLPFDLQKYETSGEITEAETLLLVYYELGQLPSYFTANLADVQIAEN
ncbi:B12-binding domain-containing radical SAM protein [Ammoniphilus oxalaticus]|uniref:B12-binding domain-containing radical SAM protein n=1 Tax=Ammoniphilus oxalaticus TaxID=66863 RepID=A0A419SIH9_9BACL|nr:B12-binding domain-containing radical SAM protein [Ammoniphilus oxalaticus]RKD23813.1 B12-binding domain-containing radical SAM protein [Ammoniphilus oxalaticus]